MNEIKWQLERSRATEPLFYHAPHPARMVPYPFQLAGVEYAISRNNALIGDAPGVGKTAECIMLSNEIRAKQTLVICPASLRLNWEKEIWMWSDTENVTTYPILKSRDGVSLKANYVITSYAMLTNPSILNAIMDARWDHLILDEAHALKDPKGNKRTQILCAPDLIPSVVGRITMASGTILPNQPIEVYNACRLLDWDCIYRMILKAFRNTYYKLGTGYVRAPREIKLPSGQTVIRSDLHWSDRVRNVPTNLADLQTRLRSKIMVRRLLPQVMPQLPTKQWHPFPLAITGKIRKALKHPGWKKAEALYEMNAAAFDAGVPIDGEIATARRELGEAKAPGVLSYVEDLICIEGKQKLVIGAWHKSVLAFFRENLSKYGLVYMDGTTSTTRKQEAVDAFQNDDRVIIILGQTIPLGMGWTLTAAQDVVVAEADWVPGVNDQLLDRIIRISQEGDYVLGHLPIVPDSMDERILSTAIIKDKNIYKALDAPL